MPVTHLPPGMGGIWGWGVEAGVGGFRSPDSAIELLVDWGVWGPCRDPEPAATQGGREWSGGAG